MAESYTCPRCGRTSYNPNDIREGYCGACHAWTRDAQPATVTALQPDADLLSAAVAVVRLWEADEVEDDDMSVAIARLRAALLPANDGGTG